MGWVEEKIEHLASTVALEGERTRLELSAGLAESVRGLRIDGALPRPARVNAMQYSSGGRLVGWSLIATGGPVRVFLRDGNDSSGDVVAVIDLLDGENQTQWVGPGGISFVDGLYADAPITTGALTGSVWIGAVD